MADCIIKLTSKTGDKGKFTARADALPDEDNVMTFLVGYTYAGATDYSYVTPGVLTTPKAIETDAVDANDMDYKAIISYKDMSVPANPSIRKIVIPCPKKNVAGGICTVQGDEAEFIPATLPVGGTGDPGNTIVTNWETALGATAGDFVFLSGGFIKKKR